MRSSANLILAISVVFALQAGLCPVLCAARSAEPAASQLDHAGPPAKAPCHETGETPSHGETRKGCDENCGHFDTVAIALSGPRADVDVPAAVLSVANVDLLAPADAVAVRRFERTPAPPPRDLLLVKNSLLI